MLEKFLIPDYGTDFTRLVPKYVSLQSNTSSFVNVISVTGSGVLNYIRFTADSGPENIIRVVVDGVEIVNSGYRFGGLAVFMFGFKTSLLVQHRGSSTSNDIYTFVSYSLA